ncbi:hypothetical protein B0H67DRAFT_640158 [Lasiosphaeris hirsuta]|uniref:DUF202 domain-containing protein n=1 Tax=Lasiosphaeris hirsuta TaxID=260670 RepID=A0AA40BDA3_9PEZI|nr:hypothetical protein B0H67DRAFT_640158 [Lasiosphaeris hirsuta]
MLRFRIPTYPATGSIARDHLASERTFLAWMRTSLGFVALGIAIERFSQLDLESLLAPLQPPSSPRDAEAAHRRRAHDRAQARLLVGALMGLGAGSIGYGAWRYFGNLRRLEGATFRPAYHGVAVLGAGLAGLAGGVGGSLVRQRGGRGESGEMV